MPTAELDMYQNLFAIGWAMHVVDVLAKAMAAKANPTPNSHISMRSTKRILCGLVVAHARLNQPHARVQIGWV